MASSEVNMHVEEVVVVTTPDSVGQGNSVEEDEKSVLVTTELEQPGEVEAELIPPNDAETISIPKDAVIVKLSEEVSVEADVLYPITCGDSKATLIWKKFVCPGINIKCVQFNEHLISPKEFVYLAGKSTLKDWKRAIRLNGAMLRKIMDSGELDFYQHSKLCSNTCRSTKIDLVGNRASLTSQTSTELTPHTPNPDVNGSPNTLNSEVCEDTTEWVTAIGEDTMNFWRNLKDAGLLEEVMSELQKEMEEALKGLQDRLQQPPLLVEDAALLNNVVQSFGMLDLVKKVLASHKSQMDRCREQYSRSLVALEQQCDEHRKRARELKSRSQTLSSVLMTLAPAATPPPPKRPRLTRAVSGPASINAHQASGITTAIVQSAASSPMALPLTQLTGLPLGRVLSGASPLLGGYTLVTSGGDGVPDGTGSLTLQQQGGGLTLLTSDPGTSSISSPSGTTILKLLSPVQILTLPQITTSTSVAPQSSLPAVPAVVPAVPGSALAPLPASVPGVTTAVVETVSATVETDMVAAAAADAAAEAAAVDTVSAAMETVSAAAVETVGSQEEDCGESEVKGEAIAGSG